MAKIALLIGISEYKPPLEQLPKAEKDVEAMRGVLVDPERGDFAEKDVTVLINPQRQEMENAIFELYQNCQQDDLVLFYFAGHGLTVENGDFYFSTPITEKNNQGELNLPTALKAATIHSYMDLSKSKRQVVILDCCHSAAFADGMTSRDSGTIDLKQQLGGEGRTILTACTSVQKAWESESLDFGIYTNYLVEGISTGAADKNGDGWIAVDELHEYAKSKVQEVSPAMTPQMYSLNRGSPIILAKSPKDDPSLKYRQEVERRINDHGKFTIPARNLLDLLRLEWKLDPLVANGIEAKVQQPYREYQRKLEKYKKTLVETIAVEPTLSERTLNDLRDYQQHLGLRDEDVAPIEKKIIGQQKPTAPEPIPPTPANQFEFDIVKVNAQGQIINRSRGRAEYFTEDLGNGVVIDMVKIPGGTFLMGSPENEPERLESESPQHSVTIQPFFMGKYTVTQAQWAAVADFDKVKIDLNPDPSWFKGANRPVERVSWDDAVEFCARISQKTGKTYRLPSEAEWEYACRAGTTTPFYFGDTITTDLANYDGKDTYGSAQGKNRAETTDVGKFPANPFGLYDMCGNVWEWCRDEWHENYNNAPADGSSWLNYNDNQSRCLRGGSWIDGHRLCRSAYRFDFSLGIHDFHFGFRIVYAVSSILQ